MIVQIKQPSPLLKRDNYSFSTLADEPKSFLIQNKTCYSLTRLSNKVIVNFTHEQDAIMFKIAFSESL